MTQQLSAIFGELGISQYLNAFIDQGFDSWETILLVTEADLDALGVKLGHRRKLQRRMANSRGVAPETAVVSLTNPSLGGAPRNGLDVSQSRPSKVERREVHVAKRKYRRHPRPDENAPERPPSAYVLFSNKMREDLKGRNLTFTEIAKLVGENWQNLCPAEKDPYESQAQFAKDQYNHDMAEYKKTADYRKYMLYLQEFRAKHAHQAADKDASKRVKLAGSGAAASCSSSTNPTPNRSSRSGSSSEGALGGDPLPPPPPPPPPPGRQRRLGSVVSMADSQHSATTTRTQASQPMAIDEPPSFSPTSYSLDCRSERSPSFSIAMSPRDTQSGLPARHGPVWLDDQQLPPPLPHQQPQPQPQPQQPQQQQQHQSLPRLYDVIDDHRLLNGPGPPSVPSEPSGASGYSFSLRNHQSTSPVPSVAVSSLRSSDSRPPSLQHEHSSAGSVSSASSGFPRTPVEASVPIQALLTGPKVGGGGAPSDSLFLQHPSLLRASPVPLDQRIQSPPQTFTPHPPVSSASMPMPNGFLHHTPPSLTPPGPAQGNGSYGESVSGVGTVGQRSSLPSPASAQRGGGNENDGDRPVLAGFDGLGALLRAGEIVDRRTSQ